ncbi:MAG: 6,7-dimethyl-8-ribityllumazine synthase [Cellulomonadaceae bacterium]|jgi:6,7-dimethyl-8-ribityllumazine synthase|nr:6,7-dimethyl-8-ribityllumazine synthase [Cellulomonadaceae bacterium]
MARTGAPAVTQPSAQLKEAASRLKIAIVAASWHTEIMDALISGAKRALADSGVTEVALIRVPGTFELPVAASVLAKDSGSDCQKPDAIVALGVVIRGGTPHFEYVCEAATMGLTQVSVESGIPVGFGVLTCDDEAQALERSGLPGASEDKGYEAAQAAVTMALTLGELKYAATFEPRSLQQG